MQNGRDFLTAFVLKVLKRLKFLSSRFICIFKKGEDFHSLNAKQNMINKSELTPYLKGKSNERDTKMIYTIEVTVCLFKYLGRKKYIVY